MALYSTFVGRQVNEIEISVLLLPGPLPYNALAFGRENPLPSTFDSYYFTIAPPGTKLTPEIRSKPSSPSTISSTSEYHFARFGQPTPEVATRLDVVANARLICIGVGTAV